MLGLYNFMPMGGWNWFDYQNYTKEQNCTKGEKSLQSINTLWQLLVNLYMPLGIHAKK